MKDATKIVIILDRSGSMESVKNATVDSLNEFINGQKQITGECSIRLVQFDDIAPYEVIFDKPLADAPKITNEMYTPRGCTPLHDAMGKGIVELGRELSSMPEHDRPNKVVFVTITDGFENASKEYNQSKVAELVSEHQTKYSWNFVFLGSNQDAVLTAKGYNISSLNSLTFASNPQSIHNTSSSLSSYIKTVRSSINGQTRGSFTEEDRTNAMV